jgi:hypothetical protein
MADLPDLLPWIIGRIGRKGHAFFGDMGYNMHASCINRGFNA